MTQRKETPVATTRVSKKGTVTVQYPKAIVADDALASSIHTMATKRTAAKELQNDADAIKKDIEREYWDEVTPSRPVMDADGVMLAEIKTITGTTKNLDTFLKMVEENLPFIMRTIEGNDDYREAWEACIAAATKESTYCKVLTK